MRETAQTRVTWRGVRITARMRDALRWAERRVQARYPGVTIVPTQGSWSNGTLSAGTHTGAGAVDLRTRHLTTDQRIATVRALKDAGLAPWYRDEADGFDPHIHVLDRVTTNMHPSARWQVQQWNARRSGLTSNRPDPSYRPNPPRKWSFPKSTPITEK